MVKARNSGKEKESIDLSTYQESLGGKREKSKKQLAVTGAAVGVLFSAQLEGKRGVSSLGT